MPEHHTPDKQTLLNRLCNWPHTIGLLVFGSFSRKEELPESDLDSWMVVDYPEVDIESFHITLSDGRRCDLWIRSADDLPEIIRRVKQGTGSTWDLIPASADILYDPDGILQDFKNELNEIIAGGVPFAPGNLMFRRFQIQHGMAALKNHLEKEPESLTKMMIATEAFTWLESYFLFQGWIFTGQRLALRELQEREPEAYGKLQSVFDEQLSLPERVNALESFADLTLRLVGGPIPKDQVFAIGRSGSQIDLFEMAHSFFKEVLGNKQDHPTP